MSKLFRKARWMDGSRTLYVLGIPMITYSVHKGKKHEACSPEDYARKLGVKVGNGCVFIVHPKRDDYPDFGSEPYLVSIGDNTMISFGVTFITHDGSVHTTRIVSGEDELIGKLGKISIGTGCFVGCKTTILPGVDIGDYAVVGACSVVTKDIPSGEVWCGNPARFVCKISALAGKHKRLSMSIEQKQLLAICNINNIAKQCQKKDK